MSSSRYVTAVVLLAAAPATTTDFPLFVIRLRAVKKSVRDWECPSATERSETEDEEKEEAPTVPRWGLIRYKIADAVPLKQICGSGSAWIRNFCLDLDQEL